MCPLEIAPAPAAAAVRDAPASRPERRGGGDGASAFDVAMRRALREKHPANPAPPKRKAQRAGDAKARTGPDSDEASAGGAMAAAPTSAAPDDSPSVDGVAATLSQPAPRTDARAVSLSGGSAGPTAVAGDLAVESPTSGSAGQSGAPTPAVPEGATGPPPGLSAAKLVAGNQKVLPTPSTPELSDLAAGPSSADPGTAGAATSPGAPSQEIEGDSPPNTAGTSAAELSAAMTKDLKAKHFSGMQEQKLPAPSAASAGLKTPATPAPGAHPTTASSRGEAQLVVDLPGATVAGSDTSFIRVGALPPVSIARATERIEDLIASHALRLQRTGDEALRVVLRPGAGLELALELRQHDGGIEVQASVQQGDFAFLNRHWAELQQQLEARGIRLGQLAGGQSGLGDPGTGAHPREFPFPSESAAAKPRGLTMEGVVAAAHPPRAAGPGRHWETWA